MGLYQNENNFKRLFIPTAFPPSVIEVDIRDPYLAYIFKVYYANVTTQEYVGKNLVATNHNYVT